MNLRDKWASHCVLLANRPTRLYSGCRKILRGELLDFPIDDSLTLADAGYTNNKLNYLHKAYLHKQSQAAAVKLWKKRKGQGRYGSVGFTTYNHFVKGPGGKRGSIMGPCIQSVVLTLLSKNSYCIDVFYRTTELFKKFPADLVFLRDVLLKPFDFEDLEFKGLSCQFANITCHPMYFVTLVPHRTDAIADLELMKTRDEFFWKWCIKWTSRYVCPEYHNGIEKFGQALRVQMDAKKRIDPKVMKRLQKYVRDNHPGFRGRIEDEIDED